MGRKAKLGAAAFFAGLAIVASLAGAGAGENRDQKITARLARQIEQKWPVPCDYERLVIFEDRSAWALCENGEVYTFDGQKTKEWSIER